MALLTFPPAPINGQLFPVSHLPGQYQYEWSSADSTWRLLGPATTVVPGCYGDASNIAAICVDAQGRLTSAANIPLTSARFVSPPATQTDPGVAGDLAYDSNWFYYYDGTAWQRVFKDFSTW